MEIPPQLARKRIPLSLGRASSLARQTAVVLPPPHNGHFNGPAQPARSGIAFPAARTRRFDPDSGVDSRRRFHRPPELRLIDPFQPRLKTNTRTSYNSRGKKLIVDSKDPSECRILTYDHEGELEALLHRLPVDLVGEVREADVAVELLGLGGRGGSRMVQQTGLLVAVLLGGDRGARRLAPIAVLRGVVRDGRRRGRRRRRRGRQPRLRAQPAQGPARVHRRRVRGCEAADRRGVRHRRRVVHLRPGDLRRRLRRRHRRHRRRRDYPYAVALEEQLTFRLDLRTTQENYNRAYLSALRRLLT